MVEEKVQELIEDMFNEYFYTNKLTSEEAREKNIGAIEVYSIGNKATFYLLKAGDTVIGSIYDDSETCIISNYSRRSDGQGDNLEDGKSGESFTH